MRFLSFILTILFITPFVGMGYLLIHLTLPSLLEARASSKWPAVSGHVTQSDVNKHPIVQYKYAVDGHEFEGSTIWFHSGHSSSDPSNSELVGRYPLGKETQVHYNPASPHRSVLQPGASAGDYVIPAIGLALMAFPSFFVIRTLVASLFRHHEGSVLWDMIKQAAGRMAFGAVFCVVGLGLFLFALLDSGADWSRAAGMMLFALPFFGAGVGVIVWQVRQIVQLFRE